MCQLLGMNCNSSASITFHSLSVTALSGLVNVTTVTNSLLSILNPVLGTLDTTLFDPLKEALGFLGIEIGGADVTNHDTRCGSRRLIG